MLLQFQLQLQFSSVYNLKKKKWLFVFALYRLTYLAQNRRKKIITNRKKAMRLSLNDSKLNIQIKNSIELKIEK